MPNESEFTGRHFKPYEEDDMQTLEQFIGERFPEKAITGVCHALRTIMQEIAGGNDPDKDGLMRHNLTANFGLSAEDADAALLILLDE